MQINSPLSKLDSFAFDRATAVMMGLIYFGEQAAGDFSTKIS